MTTRGESVVLVLAAGQTGCARQPPKVLHTAPAATCRRIRCTRSARLSPTASKSWCWAGIRTASRRSSTNSPALSGRTVDIAMPHSDRWPRPHGTLVDGHTQGLSVERMMRRNAPKITQIQRRFASSRFAADIVMLEGGARRRPRNHHCRCEAPVIRTGNLDRAQRRRRAASRQYVIDSDEWR